MFVHVSGTVRYALPCSGVFHTSAFSFEIKDFAPPRLSHRVKLSPCCLSLAMCSVLFFPCVCFYVVIVAVLCLRCLSAHICICLLSVSCGFAGFL